VEKEKLLIVYNSKRAKGEKMKDHKFFERFLDVNTDRLAEYLAYQYDRIQDQTLPGIKELGQGEIWTESGSLSTVKWREYNVFQFLNPDIYKLYKTIGEVMREACEYYELDFAKQEYMVQGWFNINHTKKGKLDWHDHGGPYAPHFHGYYSVKAEPSVTYYRIFNDPEREVANHNIDNRMIISEMGHPHAQADWDWEGPRITVAYDIVPLKSLAQARASEQHWIPLC
jgi:hypothetical protein